MLITNYDFYKDIYGGSNIPSKEVFFGLSVRAGCFIDKITFKRIDENKLTDKIEMAICAVADEMYNIQKVGVKTTETVGNHTVSYANSNSSNESKFYSASKMYLSDELLYRGVY